MNINNLFRRLSLVGFLLTIPFVGGACELLGIYEIEGVVWLEKADENLGFLIDGDTIDYYACDDGKVKPHGGSADIKELDGDQFVVEKNGVKSTIKYTIEGDTLKTTEEKAGDLNFKEVETGDSCSGDGTSSISISICLDDEIGDGYCNVGCNNEENNFDDGDCICDSEEVGDGTCNVACMTEANNYDAGDCDSECSSGYPEDGICDLECFSPDYQFDGGDCEDENWE